MPSPSQPPQQVKGRRGSSPPPSSRRPRPRSEASADPRRAAIERFLQSDDGWSVVYQPIVDLRRGVVAGAEALARFATTPFRTPDLWFADAWAVGLGVDLELAAIRRALDRHHELPEGAYLSVNASAATLGAPALRALIAGVDGSRVVVELTEHVQVDDYDVLQTALGNLRLLGVRVAVDDAGAGFASLQHILRLRPEVIKLDRSLTRAVDCEPARYALAHALVVFARSIGASICAEGIETDTELVALQRLGVGYGQGYFLGRPGALPLPVPPRDLWLFQEALALAAGSSVSPPSQLQQANADRAASTTRDPSPLPIPESARRFEDEERSSGYSAMAGETKDGARSVARLLDGTSPANFQRLARLAVSALGGASAVVSFAHGEPFVAHRDRTLDFADVLIDESVQRDERAATAAEDMARLKAIALHVVTARSPVAIREGTSQAFFRDLEGGEGAVANASAPATFVAFAGVPLVDGEGQAIGALCVAATSPRAWTLEDLRVLRDLGALALTELELAGARRYLRARDAFLRSLFEQNSMPLIVVDASSQIVGTSVTFDQLLGYEVGTLNHRPLRAILAPEFAEQGLMTRAALINGRALGQVLEVCYLARGGERIRAKVSLSVIRNTFDGRPLTLGWVERLPD